VSSSTDHAAGAVLDGLGRWCYAGEEPETVAAMGDGRVAVTTHRLLLFDPSDGGQPLLNVARPNVLGVPVDASGRPRTSNTCHRWSSTRSPSSTAGAASRLSTPARCSRPNAHGVRRSAASPRWHRPSGSASNCCRPRSSSASRLCRRLVPAGRTVPPVAPSAVRRRARRQESRSSALPASDVDADRLRAALGSDDGSGVVPGGNSERGDDGEFGLHPSSPRTAAVGEATRGGASEVRPGVSGRRRGPRPPDGSEPPFGVDGGASRSGFTDTFRLDGSERRTRGRGARSVGGRLRVRVRRRPPRRELIGRPPASSRRPVFRAVRPAAACSSRRSGSSACTPPARACRPSPAGTTRTRGRSRSCRHRTGGVRPSFPGCR